MSDFKDIKGVGETSITKLEETGFNTLEEVKDLSVDELVEKTNIKKDVAEKIIETVNPKQEPEEKVSDFDLSKQNPYLVVGFKASQYYTDDENEIEENFNKYLEIGG